MNQIANMHGTENICVILVEPQGPANVGMVCRAMKNMGLRRLRLVNPCSLEHPDALKYAVSAKDLLENAEYFPTLSAALADCPYSVATTRRHGKYRQEIIPVREIVDRIQDVILCNQVALVFGREDSGLSTEEVSLCRWQSTIATSDEYGSLNLAQAVLIFCYELFIGLSAVSDAEPRKLAPAALSEEMYCQMERTLLRIGFLNPQKPAHIMRTFRRILSRAELDEREIAVFRGMMSQIDWATAEYKGKKGK